MKNDLLLWIIKTYFLEKSLKYLHGQWFSKGFYKFIPNILVPMEFKSFAIKEQTLNLTLILFLFIRA